MLKNHTMAKLMSKDLAMLNTVMKTSSHTLTKVIVSIVSVSVLAFLFLSMKIIPVVQV